MVGHAVRHEASKITELPGWFHPFQSILKLDGEIPVAFVSEERRLCQSLGASFSSPFRLIEHKIGCVVALRVDVVYNLILARFMFVNLDRTLVNLDASVLFAYD